MIHVPYKEGAVALTERDVGPGRLHVLSPGRGRCRRSRPASSARSAPAARVRSAAAPEVPTLMEQGVKDFDLVAWFMLYAPAATPPAALAALRDASAQALAQPELMARLREQGVEQRPMRGDETGAFQPRRARQVGRAGEALRRASGLNLQNDRSQRDHQETDHDPSHLHSPRDRRGRPCRRRRPVVRAVGHADPHRQHAGAHRAALGDGADPQARRRDLRRAAQQARRPARPAGRVDRQGRPVQARPGAHAVRAARHRRQGRPADGPLRHRRDPLGDGRGAALQQGAGAPHPRRALARQVRDAVPGLVARLGAAEHGDRHASSTRWPPGPSRPRPWRS